MKRIKGEKLFEEFLEDRGLVEDYQRFCEEITNEEYIIKDYFERLEKDL